MKKAMYLLIFAASVLSACSSYNFYSVNNRADLSAYKTFAWIPGGDSKTNNFYNNDIATDKIIQAANLELESRGLKLNNNRPDLLIRYSAVVKNETRNYNQPVYYQSPARYVPRMGYYNGRRFYFYQYQRPFPIYVGSEMRKQHIEEGNVMIDVIDRKSSKVIWRGWGEGIVNNPEKAINDLPKVVNKIFDKFPSK